MATTTLKRSTDASSGHSKKVIQINAEFFKPTSAKTRRQRAPRGGAGDKGKDKDKDAFLSLKPIVSPSQLRSKLLRRIQEHKQRALSPSASASASASAGRRAHANKQTSASRRKETEAEEGEEDEDEDDGDEEEAGGGADDFQEALQFMKRRQSQQKRTATTPAATAGSHRTTARLPPLRTQAPGPGTSGPVVNTVLPPELMPEHGAGSDNGTLYVTDPVPYGCLKGGHKKTYRQWKGLAAATQGPDLVRPPTPPKRHSSPSSSSLTAPVGPRGATSMSQDRAARLEQLQAKLRRASEKERLASSEGPSDGSGTCSGTDADDTNAAGNRRLVKKTTKRTFTLGKSAHRRNVAVLVKDRRTIKRIHQAQQSLKQTSMHDVRRYLRQHGMMKVGSTCPPELLRKTFEASMLTGDVTNLSADVLLHNYMARDEPASE